MTYNFSDFNAKSKDIESWLKKEYSNLGTGQAAPSILDSILIDSYGSKMPINQLSQVTIEDARTLRIAPWDLSLIKNIEKSVLTSSLGITPRVDETGLRIIFPPLTSERRSALAKVAKEKLENAKISIRNERERVMKDIQTKEKDKKMTEDDARKAKAELQRLVDTANKTIEEAERRKEKEILQ